MRTIVKRYKVYRFSELTPEAQKKALEKLYDINVDYEWWESVYEDATTIGIVIQEFDLDRRSYCKGKFLFSHEEVAQNIIANHGEQCETHKTASIFLAALIHLRKKIEKDEFGDDLFSQELQDQTEDLEQEFEKSLFEDYRIMLQKEYEYRTSEEAIIESIEANDYEFKIDGSLN